MLARATCLSLAALVAAPGCAARRQAALVAEPIAAGRSWLSARYRDHPLAGRIWDVRAGRFTDEARLVGAMAGAGFALLGETHDNPDHNVLEARLVRALVAAGRRPALAFEMLAVERQPDVEAALARAPRDPGALAESVGWAQSGWPPFAQYRPVFLAGLEAGLPIRAANLSHRVVRNVLAEGAEALPAAVRARIDRRGPPSAEEREEVREEMYESHCGEFPEERLDPMVLVQRARDAQMADVLERAGEGRGAVLVAGAGHVREDRGVPAYLGAGPGAAVAVALREVEPERLDPAAYGEDYRPPSLPFDFVVFTAAAEREDPCDRLRERMRSRPGGSRTRSR